MDLLKKQHEEVIKHLVADQGAVELKKQKEFYEKKIQELSKELAQNKELFAKK